MVAEVAFGLKGSIQVCGDHFFHGSGLDSDQNINPFLVEEFNGTLAHTAGKDDVDPAYRQPLREQARLVGWGVDGAEPPIDEGIFLGDIKEGELGTMAEVRVECS